MVKARREVIEQRYDQAVSLANAQLDEISREAIERFNQRFEREIERLQFLQTINPNVRDSEIHQLKRLHEQGLQALGQLTLIPDSIRVLIAVKPN